MAVPTEKPRPASTFLEKLAEKLTKKRDGEMVADEDVVKESGTRNSGSMKVKGKWGKKGKKPSKFGATSFMSEESSSEDDEEQEEGLEEELKTNNLKDRIKEVSTISNNVNQFYVFQSFILYLVHCII